LRRKLPAQVQQEIAALRDFNLACVGSESIASDRYVARGRGMSASPPEATELMQRRELSRCANRDLAHCSKKHHYSITSSASASIVGGEIR
jgi:hypothetical protein